ncbi:P-loop containing nucleoside triphosphate hydrolase protein [Umbelopsis sp. PMI_123]|nr:P-loop containing nucleoside triphosphate hydrolase protein [Umbelopsis sp. PMI_123]
MAPGAKVVHFGNDDDDQFIIHDNKHTSKRRRVQNGIHEHGADQPNDRAESNRPRAPTQKQENVLQRRKQELFTFRKSLPVYSARDQIIKGVQENDTVVIVGETGSGKTTQIPQFLLECGIGSQGRGTIAVTQPRRVAATSLAKRVAEEVGTTLGYKVGYTVRFDDTSSQHTMIKYLTDGMLLRELISDKLLRRYSVIMLDEAHERTLRTDMLFGMVKAIQQTRKEMVQRGEKDICELKIVVMSATLDAEKFSEYFNRAQIMYVSGRLFPVKVYNTIEPQSDYLDAALVTIFQVHMRRPKGDILVFLTGQEEIETLTALLTEYAGQLPSSVQALLPCPLFAALPPAQQQKVFDPAPSNTRKVVLATNIAETSITISGIRYVIDCGVAKVRGFNAKIGVESLLVHPISKSSARQRMGRAGREAAGFCYRLYTETSFADLEENTVPEIKRCNLAAAVLNLKAAGVEDVLGFDYMDRPSRTSLSRALEQLYSLCAINDKGLLTEEGKQMAEFPLDPVFSKVLIQSQQYECTSEVISIISLLSVDSVFFTPPDKRDNVADAKKRFVHPDGDHLTLLNVLKSYWEVKGDKEWCRENFINMRNMKIVLDVRNQLIQFCTRMGIVSSASAGNETDAILKSFLSGFFQNTALLQPDGTYKSVLGGQTISIHPGSSMFGKRVEAIMYNELVFTTKQYVRGVSSVQAAWLPMAAPKYFGNSKLTSSTTNS